MSDAEAPEPRDAEAPQEHYRQAMIVNARPGARQRQRRLSAVAPVVAAMEELPSSDGQATRGVSSLRSEAP